MSAIAHRAHTRARRRHTSFAERLASLADRAYGALIIAAIALYFFLSEFMLTNLGISYAEGGGNPLEKIHPATWLSFALLLYLGIRRGNPLRILDMISAYRGLAIFFLSWIMLFAWSVAVVKVPFSPLIDTFLSAIAIFLLVQDLDPAKLRVIAIIIHAIMTANALLGLYEYLSGWRLTPYAIGSITIEGDWRSTAILGHPLANAGMTGSYIVALALGGGSDLPTLARPAMIALQLVAMIAFGGRSSLVNALIIMAGVAAWRSYGILRGQRFDPLHVAIACFLAPLAIAAIAGAAIAGFFDQFILRFSDDLGSAKARLIMLDFFNIVPTRDIIIGPDQAYISSLQSLEGIEFGLESFWVGFIFAYGAIMALVFFLGLFAFCWQLVRQTRTATWALLLYFFAVASTSVSMSVKTVTFTMFVCMILSLMRAPARLGALR